MEEKMATRKEATVKKATLAAAPLKVATVEQITVTTGEEISASKTADTTQNATNKKKIVVVKKAPTKTKKPVAAPVVVDAIAQKGASQPHTIIHPDAPWPFKKP